MSTIGPDNHLVETSSNLQITSSTFFYATPKLWNQRVTKTQAEAPSADSFKKHFDKE